ncbi:MAG: hypothetical protein HYW57_06640 [Ignavibacteriales bacterium]|nr:hypothetical protein [Ignavibacteriales bacterium]
MRMGFGAEGIGFGNALTATPTNTITGYYNPAMTPFQPQPTVVASVGFLSLDRNLNFLSFTRPLPPSAGMSFGLINSGVSNIDGRDSDGRHTQTLSTSENVFFLSFGLKVDPKVAIGISTKILYHSLYTNISSTTVGFDLGAVLTITTEWTVGLCIQDIGSKYKWDTSKLYGLNGNTTTDFFPVRKKLGLSYRPQGLAGLISSEVELSARMFLWRAGIQYSLLDEFAVRGGFDQISISEDIAAKPSLGFSTIARISNVTAFLGYAFVFEPYSPAGIHMVSVGVHFN